MNRRNFLAATSALAACATPASRALAAVPETKVTLKQGDVVLFQGDSITDAGRKRETQDEPNNGAALGRGYASVIAGGLLVDHRSLQLKTFNRGISGHKVPDLQKRWQADTIDLKPALISILIGVNDIWHKLNGKYEGTPESYSAELDALLESTRAALPDTTLVICEPFALKCGAVKDNWFPEFDQRREFCHAAARKAGAIWVPFQTMFDDAVAAGTTPDFWAGDGVHPTVAGHALMAAAWRRATGL